MTGPSDTIVVKPSHSGVIFLGAVSIFFAIATIPFLFISVHRVYTLQKSEACLVREKPFYVTIDTLCSVLPSVSLISGVLSLFRFRRKRMHFATVIPALAGIVISITAFSIYFLVLLSLARNPIYS
jgi:hypothetical protein